eukprot:gene12508-13792_t
MPLMKKFGEDSRSFQDEGLVNFAEYSTDERKTICIVAPYQLTNEKRDEEQLMRFYRNELLACMKKKGFTEMQIKRVKVEKPRETKEVKAINEKPKDPRRRPAEHAKCKFKTLSNIAKIKPVSRSVPRVPAKSTKNFETEVNPNSFVVDEVLVSDDVNEADNVISNIFDDILPMNEPIPTTGVSEEFSISDIVFPNDPPAPPPSMR